MSLFSIWNWLPLLFPDLLHTKNAYFVPVATSSRWFHLNWSCVLWSECRALKVIPPPEGRPVEGSRLLLAGTENEWIVHQKNNCGVLVFFFLCFQVENNFLPSHLTDGNLIWYRLSSYNVTKRTYLTVSCFLFLQCLKNQNPSIFQKLL